MRILILDDDLGFLLWMAKVLEPLGHCVIPAETASKADRLIRKWRPSIDLLIVNPVVRGADEFCQRLRRSQQGGPATKVVVLVSEQGQIYRGAIQADAARAKPAFRSATPLQTADAICDRPASEWASFVQEILDRKTARAN